MRAVQRRNTRPELIVRSLAHRMGYRFRLQRADLPGKPDIVFPSRKLVIFVHGCFWHGHSCKRGKRPDSNTDFWNDKLSKNVERDAVQIDKLITLGWRTLVIWECETRDADLVSKKLKEALER